jgi:uncharacterized membrane protein YcaP (DUF421 family)
MRPFSWHEVWVPTWPPAEIVFRSVFVYLFIQLLFRILGRKEWTRYSAFNVTALFLIAVALRTTMTGEDHSVTSGLLAITSLLATNWVFSYLSYCSERMASLLQGNPRQLIKGGMIQRQEMNKARISESRLLEEIRLKGYSSFSDVEDACLERIGQISIRFKRGSDREASRRAA